ncbi:MAG: GntR family transcriptional regulator [Planctomycetota bacterium]|jgi:GntR family transcriptional regulator|nr:GntR family transcriptional regulator [Planctomycetota bacterium]
MSESVYQRIADELSQRILNGSLAAETRLPTTKELAASYGVAINTVHQSMKVLADRGLVVRQPKRGTFVSRGASATSIAIVLGSDVFADDDKSFHRVLIGHLQKILAEDGWATTVHLAARPESRRHVLEGVYAEMTAGRSRAALLVSSDELVGEFESRCDAPWSYTQASIDTDDLAFRCVDHLLTRGHHDIVLLADWSFDDTDPRAIAAKAGALRAFQAHQRTPPPDAFCYRGCGARAGMQAVEQMRSQRGTMPAAIACLNDRTTLGLVMGITAHGLRLGTDLALISHANVGIDILSPVPLTTIAYDPTEFARAAWHNLQLAMAGKRRLDNHLVTGHLMPGNSC